MVGELADGGYIVGGILLSSITFLKLLTSSGAKVVKLGLDGGKCCTETNFSLTKETDELMLIGVCEWFYVNYYCIITMVGCV